MHPSLSPVCLLLVVVIVPLECSITTRLAHSTTRLANLALYSHRSLNSKYAGLSTKAHLSPLDKSAAVGQSQRKGAMALNRLFLESFVKPTFFADESRAGRRKSVMSDIPSALLRVYRGLSNFTITVGRTINQENGNGTLSRLITNRLVNVSESLMGWVERSMNDLPCIPRLDAQECVKRCICEAHNQPKKYGAVGLFLQLFFPPYLDADSEKVVSKYQLAARYGRGDNANCAVQYDGCMVNVLDLLQGAINMIL